MRVPVAILLLMLTAFPAYGQVPAPPCGPRAEIVAQLNADYGEVLKAMARGGNGEIIEFWVSAEGSFTILVGNGLTACLAATGSGWTDAPKGRPA